MGIKQSFNVEFIMWNAPMAN